LGLGTITTHTHYFFFTRMPALQPQHTTATMDYLHAVLADSLLSALHKAHQPGVKGQPALVATPEPPEEPRATVYIPVTSVTTVAPGCAHVLCAECGQMKHPLFALQTPCCHHICYPCYTSIVKRVPRGRVITCPDYACAQSLPQYKWIHTNKDGVKYKSELPFIANYDRDSRHLLQAGYPSTLQFRAQPGQVAQPAQPSETEAQAQQEEAEEEEEEEGEGEEEHVSETQDDMPQPQPARKCRKRIIEGSDDDEEEEDAKRWRRE
jgi:hypothetical protein